MSDTPVPPVPDAETEMAYAMPAVYSDRFYIHIDAGGVRITFSEVAPLDRPPIPRSAILLSHENAMGLSELLKRVMEQHLLKASKKDVA